MNFLHILQLLQALLAIFVIVCLFKKNVVKSYHFHVAFVTLVVSILIIPPFGRNFLNGTSELLGGKGKEGMTSHCSPIISASDKQQAAQILLLTPEQLCDIVNMETGAAPSPGTGGAPPKGMTNTEIKKISEFLTEMKKDTLGTYLDGKIPNLKGILLGMVNSCGSKETQKKVTLIMGSTPEDICKMIKSGAAGAANKVPIGLTILSESPEIAQVIMMILGAPIQLEAGGMIKGLEKIASG